MFRRSCLTALLLASFIVGRVAPAPAEISSNIIQQWVAAWMGDKDHFSEQEAVDIATSFDVVAAHPNMFRDYTAKMRKANPDIEILAYTNGMWAPGDAYPDSYYARNSKGTRIKWIPYNTYLLSPDARWADQAAANCRALAMAGTYDGCLIDNLGPSPITTRADKEGAPPVNPATGKAYSIAEWLRGTASVARAVKQQNPGFTIVGNGIGDGGNYFNAKAPTSVLSDEVDGGMIEQFVRSPRDPVTKYRAEGAWLKDVKMLQDMQSRGSHAYAMTKVWVDATLEQKEAWHSYALATFLLGTDGKSYFAFLEDSADYSDRERQSWHQNQLGAPSGPYTKMKGYYRRNFVQGIALVNPTAKSVTVTLDREYTDLYGDPRSGTITLGPHSGEVLRAS